MTFSRLALTFVVSAGLLLVAVSSCTSDHNTPDPLPPSTPTPVAQPVKAAPLMHRASAVACSTDKVAGDVDATEAADPRADCKADGDCTQGKNGRCAMTGGGRMRPAPRCVYDACVVDSDCGAKSACDCGTAVNDGHACMEGNCAVDADCGEGGFCSPSMGSCGNYRGVVGNFCHTAKDECVNDGDCSSEPGAYCAWKEEVGHWQCSTSQCMG
jgi:hypothetical protein